MQITTTSTVLSPGWGHVYVDAAERVFLMMFFARTRYVDDSSYGSTVYIYYVVRLSSFTL